MSKLQVCHIYRSSRKADTYLYVLEKDDFSEVPEELMTVFGEPEFSFSFNLTSDRQLAKEDSAEVLANLKEKGYHLQLASNLLIEQQLALKKLN